AGSPGPGARRGGAAGRAGGARAAGQPGAARLDRCPAGRRRAGAEDGDSLRAGGEWGRGTAAVRRLPINVAAAHPETGSERTSGMGKKGELIVGLDIGTTKICAIVGEATDEGIDIIGIGSHPSKGLRKGVVVNIEATVSSIKRAIEEAELMAGCEINTVFTGIAGGHIKGFNSQGIVAVKDKEVRETDIGR